MLKSLEEILNYHFRDATLLQQALTHSSVTSHVGKNYERLEFLGDRVLGVAVAHALFKEYPHEPEGSLSPRQTHLVCKETVAEIARHLQLDQYMQVATEDIRQNENVLCDVCEAVIGAIFIDSDCQTAIRFVQKHWQDLLHKDITPPKDFKTKLQEVAHAQGYPTPVYQEVAREGSEHNPIFTMQVRIEGLMPQTGNGHNKKLAEQAAAAKMISVLEGK